ncbi:hypothetical protein HYPSUDRAFT_202842 [Hypholoma sublateritium FD-334 SS-4]|uniref:Uncharacterized protein n=1 Tax=Hypholoma sublateritium (strain FD-334 SS-4) TaxID=945553 RepID=A0A0D2MD73_HYPSF|nr:hypothetical protein HYPSUDRAFT_202842 [Hypholoma sublateritium FD-334 SS-4]
MPPKALRKPKIPKIPWNDDLTWQFLSQCELPANYKILFGKKDTTKNTSGDTKVSVFKRIALALLPDLYALDASTIANRLKGQLERLTKTYRKHATWLRQTGEGVGEGENSQDSDRAEEQLSYYISGEGPNAQTPANAVNLWEEIEKEFKPPVNLNHVPTLPLAPSLL